MFNLFKKEKENKNDGNHLSLISVAALLIHSAKIDENFTEKEKTIIKNALIEMGADENNLDKIMYTEVKTHQLSLNHLKTRLTDCPLKFLLRGEKSHHSS